MRAGTAGAGSEAVSLPRNAETIAVVLLVLGAVFQEPQGCLKLQRVLNPI
jgi:hypothetical protein